MARTPETREATLRAILLIQKWFRRYKARLEFKRKTSWIIYQSIETKNEANHMHLLSFFTDIIGLNSEGKSPEATLVEKSSSKHFYERLLKYGDKQDRTLLMDTGFNDIIIESTYKGPHLTFPLTAIQVHVLIDSFKIGHQLHAKYLLQLLHEARVILKTRQNITQVSISISKQVTVVGDLHGFLIDLLTIFDKNGLPDVTNPYVFNGDYVDRGPKSVEVMVLLCACLIVWPTSVFLNRGNHEDPYMNQRYGFPNNVKAMYEQYGDRVVTMFEDFFSWLPLATIIDNRIFVTHGGVSDKIDLKIIQNIDRHCFISPGGLYLRPKKSVDPNEVNQVIELLWNDPRPENGCRPGDRGCGFFFGPDVTAKFLKNNNLSLVVRSHECVPEGYQFEHNKKLLTVFSASNYDTTNKGAFVKFNTDGEPQLIQYVTSEAAFRSMGRRISHVEETALRTLRVQIASSKSELLQAFRRLDPDSTGFLTTTQWCTVMKSTLNLNLPWRLLRNHLTKQTVEGKIIYMTTFDQVTIAFRAREPSSVTEILYKNKDELEAIFRIIDSDDVGHISVDDFKECCKLVCAAKNRKDLTMEQIAEIANMVDLNKDGKIDFNEFLEAFRIVDTGQAIKQDKFAQLIPVKINRN